jgi:predicted SprT family Zn-dependent metalloprotease
VRRSLDFLAELMGPRNGSLLDEVARGGAVFEDIVFTQNRRVMVSVGDGGRILRLHASFASAPAEVLRAVGALLSPRRRGRAHARRAIRGFIAGIPTPAPVRRTRRIPPADRPHILCLQAEFDRVNDEYFAGSLPRVPLYLSGRMRRRNGHFSADPLEVVISRQLCEQGEEGEAASTLRHEMIHLWQHHRGRRPDHGGEFRQWARTLDVHPRATREVGWKGKKLEARS